MRAIAVLRKLAGDQEAATAVEYALILALIFLGLVGAVSALGGEGTGLWAHVKSKVVAAMTGD